ncbi:YdcF family protein [Pelagibius sp. 7325]|uniref:YdcF family protein n=1 Tax=Pelagibius sp. 7325 TaxID=3131994 RepID=UPI0030EDE72E
MATVFFFASKIVWFFMTPLNSLIFLLLAWLLFRRLAWRRLAGLALALLLLYGGAILLTPLPELAVRTLENRFPQPAVDGAAIGGIIVLGGATDDGVVAEARGQAVLNGAAERLTTAIALHRVQADKTLIVSGFSGRLRPQGWNEAEITTRFFEQQGVDMARVRFEDQSRNTAENARLTAAMIGAMGGAAERPWLLITSAWHLPRAIAAFRAADLAVLPYPVDFRTAPAQLVWPRDIGSSLGLAGIAMHEWLGMLVYWLSGDGSELFAAPR